MENELLAGGKNIVDRTDEQKKILEKQRQEMIEQKRREREIRQQLESKEESVLEIRDLLFSSGRGRPQDQETQQVEVQAEGT